MIASNQVQLHFKTTCFQGFLMSPWPAINDQHRCSGGRGLTRHGGRTNWVGEHERFLLGPLGAENIPWWCCISTISMIFFFIHTYIHTYMHTCIHTYIHTWIHDHTYITYMIIRAYIHTCIGNVVLHKYHMHRKCGAAQVPLVLLILLQHWYLFSTFFLFQRYFPSTCYGNNSKFLDPSCSGLSLRIDDGLQPNVGTQEHPHQKFLHVMYDHYLPTAISNSSIYIKLNLTVPARCVIPSLPTFSQRCAASVQQLLTHDVRRRTLLGDTALALATWNTFSCMGLDIFHSTRVAHSDCDHLLVVSVKLVVDILDGCRIKMLIIDV